MKSTSLIALSILFLISACEKKVNPPEFFETEPHSHEAVVGDISDICKGYYVGLPASYATQSKSYPVLISVHGYGDLGDAEGLEDIVKHSVGNLLENKTFPPNFVSGGKNFSFIVVSPRFTVRPTPVQFDEVVRYIVGKYRVDQTRVYMCGNSMGGGIVWDYSGIYPGKVAAITPFSGESKVNDSKASAIAGSNLPVWAFHDKVDNTVPASNSIDYVNAINELKPTNLAKLTIWDKVEHDSWTRAVDPTYKEDGMNIYEWMLQYHR